MPWAKGRELLFSELLRVELCTDCACHFYTHMLYRWMTLPELRGEQGLCPFAHAALITDVPSHRAALCCCVSAQRGSASLKIICGEALIPSCVFQVLEDPAGNPVTNDTFWAAWLLFEFSAGGRMWPACRDAQRGLRFPRKCPILSWFFPFFS